MAIGTLTAYSLSDNATSIECNSNRSPRSSLGKSWKYFEELEREAEEEISDEDYSPISETEAGFVSRQSPITAQELAAKSDQGHS